MVVSLLPVTIKERVGCQSQVVSSELCSLNLYSILEVAKSQTLAEVSSEQETNLTDEVEKLRSLTQLSACALNLFF